jgi:hypothetical protein
LPKHEPETLKAIIQATAETDSDADAAWFKENPKRSFRLRLPTAGERRLSSTEQALFDPPLREDETGELAVLVRQKEPGVRFRVSIILRVPRDLSLEALTLSANDDRCALLWEQKVGHNTSAAAILQNLEKGK